MKCRNCGHKIIACTNTSIGDFYLHYKPAYVGKRRNVLMCFCGCKNPQPQKEE